MTSFLEQIQKKRQMLQQTKTIVTTTTGHRYEETRCGEQNVLLITPLQEHSHGFVVDTSPDSTPACIIKDFLYLGSQDAVTLENVKNFMVIHISCQCLLKKELIKNPEW